ncbi:MAG: Lrp/AsnC ligand binding domain-containing protein [Nitrosopumilaceae archaeon]|jgi:DNA-binding Lrp family transcriptional regulator
MKKRSFVLLTCIPGEEYKTQNILSKVPQVKNIHIVKGAYDIVVKITTTSIHELKEILWKIRRLSTVRATLTLKTWI